MTDRIDFGGQPWGAVPRSTMRDARLTPRAKGGLITLLSHEEGWVRSAIACLQRENQCGKDQAQGIMRELVGLGYAERVRDRDEAGQIRDHYVVRAIPSGSEADTGGFPVDGEPSHRDSPQAGLPAGVVEALDVEPLEEEPQNNQMLASTSSPRPPDLIFEALFGLETGKVYSPETAKILTPSARAALNKAVAEVKATGISVIDLGAAVRAWPMVMGDATCTANAVAKHLPRLVSAANGNIARMTMPSDEDKVLAELRRRREEKEALGG